MPSKLRPAAYVGNVRTSEVCARAPCASGRRAWRRRARDGSPPCVRRGRAPPRPRGSSALRRPAPRPAARRPSAPRHGCGRRSGRARRGPSRPSRPRRASRTPASAASIASRAGRFCRARRRRRRARAAPARGRTGRRPPRARRPRASSAVHGLLDVSLRRFEQASAACDLREHPVTADTHGVRLPGVQQRHGLVRPAERDQRLGVVGAPPAQVRLAPAGCIGRRLGPWRTRPQPQLGSPLQQVDDALDGLQPAEVSAFPVGELAARARRARGRARGRRDGRRRVRAGTRETGRGTPY